MQLYTTREYWQQHCSGLSRALPRLSVALQQQKYDVDYQVHRDGTYTLNIKKGGLWARICGVNIQLCLRFIPEREGFQIRQDIGSLMQQGIPALIAFALFIPLLAFPVWGMWNQGRKLRDIMDMLREELSGSR